MRSAVSCTHVHLREGAYRRRTETGAVRTMSYYPAIAAAGDGVSDQVELTLEADPRSPSQARHFVTEQLTRRGGAELVDAAELLVSELVTNAVLHAGSRVTVALAMRAGGVRVEVSDGSTQGPRPRRFSDDASTGRGLLLVEAIAADWGVRDTDGGKTVWFELAPSA